MQFGLTLKMELLLLSQAHRAEIDDRGEILMTFDIIASLLAPLQALFGGCLHPWSSRWGAHPVGITAAPFHMI
jgi:hypothetical protein